MRSSLLPALAAVATLACLLAVVERPAGASISPASGSFENTDEAMIKQLIEQMGSRKYKTREKAYKRLKAMGPAAIPSLARYRGHEDPEIAGRIEALINENRWMTRGAIIVWMDRDMPAGKMGLKVGDVVVKINETDITGYKDINTVSSSQLTYHIFRSGKIIQVESPTGKIGITVSNWDFLKGGNDQSRGMAALSAKRYDEAYARLDQARRDGMEDRYVLNYLIGLAEYHLDHKRAMEVYSVYRKLVGPQVDEQSHQYAFRHSNLPIGTVRTAYLMHRMKAEPFSVELWHQLDTWFLRGGMNLPMARQIAAKKWPADAAAAAGPHAQFWHGWSRMKLALVQRRWDDVLTKFTAAPSRRTANMALLAAMEKGDVERACNVGLYLLSKSRDQGYYLPSEWMYACAAAYLGGRDDLAGQLWQEVTKASPRGFDRTFTSTYEMLLGHPVLAEKMLPALRPLAARPGCKRAALRLLRVMRDQPDLTPQMWSEAFEQLGNRTVWKRYFGSANVYAGLRFGRYHQFMEFTRKYWPAHAVNDAYFRTAEVLSENAERLDSDWSDLKGTLRIYDGPKKGEFQAVRYDGRAFYVDPEGKVHPYPDLAASAPGDRIVVVTSSSAGTICVGRRAQIYLLDEQNRRWIASYAGSGIRSEVWTFSRAAPAAVKYVIKEYPVTGSGREATWSDNGPKGWRWIIFNGGIGIVVNPATRKVVDLSRRIGALAGEGGRVAVYRCGAVGENLLVPTDRGLWMMDPQAKITPVALPTGQKNVMTVILRYPARKGKVYVGVVPQQGGQVYEMDVKTGKMSLTGGYCGVGPEDAYVYFEINHRRLPCEYALEAIYRARRERDDESSNVATQP